MTPERELQDLIAKWRAEAKLFNQTDARWFQCNEHADELEKLLAAAPAPTPAPPMCPTCNSTDKAVKHLAEVVQGEVLRCWDSWHGPVVPERGPHEPQLYAADGPVTGKEGKYTVAHIGCICGWNSDGKSYNKQGDWWAHVAAAPRAAQVPHPSVMMGIEATRGVSRGETPQQIKEGDEVWVRGEVSVTEDDESWIEVSFNSATGHQQLSFQPSDMAIVPRATDTDLREKEITVANHIRQAAADGCQCEPCIAAREAMAPRAAGGRREVFDKYAQHLPGCDYFRGEQERHCSCGLGQVKAALAAAAEPQVEGERKT